MVVFPINILDVHWLAASIDVIEKGLYHGFLSSRWTKSATIIRKVDIAGNFNDC
jgi:hypothetical protein